MNENQNLNKHYWVILAIFAGVMFFVYSYLNFTVWLPQYSQTHHLISNWPDAMANQAFIQSFIDQNSFFIDFPGNSMVNHIVHPRSVNVFGDHLVPMGFVGLIVIFGLIGKIITLPGTLFLTPLVAAGVLLLFFSILKYIFSVRAAFISAILLGISAPFWYFSSQPMLPTILFIFLIMLGVFLVLKADHKYWWLWPSLSGVVIGLGIMVRLVEIPWVLLIVALLLIFPKKENRWAKVVALTVGLVIILIPFLFINHSLYGSYLGTGYTELNTDRPLVERLPSEFTISGGNSVISFIKAIILSFGFHPRVIWYNFYQYFFQVNWPLILLSMAGFIWLLVSDRKNKSLHYYLYLSALIGIWIFLYYGSWLLLDNQVRLYNFISVSQVRYFMPALIMMIPMAGYFIDHLLELKIEKKIHVYFGVGIVSTIILLTSINTVLLHPYDGLFKVRRDLNEYYDRYRAVSNIVENDAIIIVDKMDKILFPQYQVVVFLEDYKIFNQMTTLATEHPIYYLTNWDEKQVEMINIGELMAVNMVFVNKTPIDQDYDLYKLVIKK